MPDRRELLGSFAALIGGAPSTVLAQFNSQSQCPAGTRLKRIVIKSETAYQERSMTILGQTVSQKVPIRIIHTEVECEPVPPPPPQPPAPKQGIFDLDYFSIYPDWLLSRGAESFLTRLLFSTSAASPSSLGASFEMKGTTYNGNQLTVAFPMVRQGNDLIFSDPVSVNTWSYNFGQYIRSSTWSVIGLSAVGNYVGSGNFGLSHHLGGIALNGYTGNFIVSSTNTGGYFNDRQ